MQCDSVPQVAASSRSACGFALTDAACQLIVLLRSGLLARLHSADHEVQCNVADLTWAAANSTSCNSNRSRLHRPHDNIFGSANVWPATGPGLIWLEPRRSNVMQCARFNVFQCILDKLPLTVGIHDPDNICSEVRSRLRNG